MVATRSAAPAFSFREAHLNLQKVVHEEAIQWWNFCSYNRLKAANLQVMTRECSVSTIATTSTMPTTASTLPTETEHAVGGMPAKVGEERTVNNDPRTDIADRIRAEDEAIVKKPPKKRTAGHLGAEDDRAGCKRLKQRNEERNKSFPTSRVLRPRRRAVGT